MAVFRIHNRADGQSDWFTSTPPSPIELASITSANRNGKVATSIPSPFARIDLVKSAFKFVSNSMSTIGNTNYHKLVSDALDVGQLFFYFDEIKAKYPNAQIIAWDPVNDLNDIINDPSTKLFGETLHLFWDQDGSVYNFNGINRLFILKINHQVVGATSPTNLFFAAPNVENLNLNFKFGNVTLFDRQYESLAERDSDFIKYVFALSRQANFSTNFSELHSYLQVTLGEMQQTNATLWNEINGFNRQTLANNYTPLNIGNGNPVDVLGIPLCCNKPDPNWILNNSDFVIQATNTSQDGQYLPLVLPTDKFFKNWIYTKQGNWDSNTNVPENDPQQVNKRSLPGQATQYPYLTIGDFFEENLIQLPYKLNDRKFHTFGSSKYLIPLKPLFFKYFSVNDLTGNNILEIDENIAGNAVEIKINIPTRRGTISYKRLYTPGKNIIERDFHFGMFPMLADPNNQVPINYHIGIINQNSSITQNIDIELFNNNLKVNNADISKVVRKAHSDGFSSESYNSTCYFDYIHLSVDSNCNGIIIPKYQTINYRPTKAKVAIDFGTTNTHIEYKYDNANEKALDIEGIYASLGKDFPAGRRIVAERTLSMELIPDAIAKDDSISFPSRTALLENISTNWAAKPHPFQDTNVAYFYERIGKQPHHQINTDLKWKAITNLNDRQRISHFIEGVLEAIKIKLLKDGIALNNLEIIWLYPVSMTSFQLGGLENIWAQSVQKVFDQNINLSKIPESIAPYNYYEKNMGLVGLTASIDIGGGTSDITLFEKTGPRLISSINFAGNAVVGDGYNSNIRLNGFVKIFEPIFRKACKNIEEFSEKESILDEIKNGVDPKSTNFCSFLFSVDGNNFDFTEYIKSDPDIKLLYVIFYATQAYYLANLIKRSEINRPDNIIFSGSGSKSLDIIDFKDRNNTKELFEFFFKKVFDSNQISLKFPKNPYHPKEITSKGALESTVTDVNNIIGFWTGEFNNEESLHFTRNSNIPNFHMALESKFKQDVINSISSFFDLFDEYCRICNLNATFGINLSALEKFKEIRSENIVDYIDKGIEEKLKSSQGKEEKLSEGLFFYPFVGILNRLGTELAQNKNHHD